MVFLLDESNIHRPIGYSSIVLVHVADLEALYALDSHVLATEKLLGIRPFHWWKARWQVREDYIRELLKADFRLRVALVRNPVSIEVEVERALTYLITERQVQRIIIDGSRPREYSSRLKKVLRDKGVKVMKLRNETDHARPALRVADCFAGLMRYHAEESTVQSAQLYQETESRIDVTMGK